MRLKVIFHKLREGGYSACKIRWKSFIWIAKIKFKVCTDVMTFFFIILYKYEKKQCFFLLSRHTNSFMCARVYLVSAEHTSTYIYIYMYWAPFSMKQLVLFPKIWSCHWVDFILSELLQYIYKSTFSNSTKNSYWANINNILISAWFCS